MSDVRFRPLQPVSRPKLIVAFVAGPLLWLGALAVAAALLQRSNAIEIGLLVSAASLVVSLIVLASLRALRRREERRYAHRG